jgi:excisionase family DNA binding protein
MKKKTGGEAAPGALLKIDDAAKFLKVRPSFLYEQTRRGIKSTVPHLRVGRYVRFRVSDLENWLSSKRLGGA